MTLRILIAAALLAPGLVATTSAQTLCSAPVAPLCMEIDSTFADPATTDRCRQDVEAYGTAVDAYGACLADQIRELEQHSDLLRAAFDCRADGGSDCPAATPLPGR